MRVLVDAGYPRTVNHAPNVEGLELARVEDGISDSGLIECAAKDGFSAVVVLDQEMVSRERLRALALELRVTVICSVTDDPFEAEANLRHAFATLATKVRDAPGAVLWLRKDGLHGDT